MTAVLAVDLGPLVLVVGVLAAVPAVLLGGMAVAGIVGWALKAEGEATHEGSELIDLNR